MVDLKLFVMLWMQLAQTPLHVAAGNNKVEVVKFLLEFTGPEKIELEAKNMVCCQLASVGTLFLFRMVFTNNVKL